MNFFTPGADPTLNATNRNLINSGQSGFWGGNNGFWSTSDGNWFNPTGGLASMMGFGAGMGGGGYGPGYAPYGFEDLMPRVEPLGVYRIYTHHSDEVVLSMRDPDTSEHRDNFTVVDRATGTILFRVKPSPYSAGTKRNIYDYAGNWLFQIRRKGLPFTDGAWIGIDPFTKRTIFCLSQKYGVQGGLGITFLNSAGQGEQVVLRIGADMFSGACRITDSHGQTVARLNKDPGAMFRYPWNTQNYNISVAGHVDSSLIMAICVCLDERQSRIPGLQH